MSHLSDPNKLKVPGRTDDCTVVCAFSSVQTHALPTRMLISEVFQHRIRPHKSQLLHPEINQQLLR